MWESKRVASTDVFDLHIATPANGEEININQSNFGDDNGDGTVTVRTAPMVISGKLDVYYEDGTSHHIDGFANHYPGFKQKVYPAGNSVCTPGDNLVYACFTPKGAPVEYVLADKNGTYKGRYVVTVTGNVFANDFELPQFVAGEIDGEVDIRVSQNGRAVVIQ